MRAQLILGKYPVVSRTSTSIRIHLGGTTQMDLDLGLQADRYDVRTGDLLTLYTEVLFKPQKES